MEERESAREGEGDINEAVPVNQSMRERGVGRASGANVDREPTKLSLILPLSLDKRKSSRSVSGCE